MARATPRDSRAGWSAFGLTLVFAVFSATAMLAAPRLLIAPFMNIDAPAERSRSRLAIALLQIAALFQIFDASQVALANMLRGVHDSRIPLVIALLGYWVIGAPVGVALGFATAARRGRRLDRPRARPRRRRHPADAALAQHGAPRLSGLTVGGAPAHNIPPHLTGITPVA